MNKLTIEFQNQFSKNLLFNPSVLERIDPVVKLHEETMDNPLSSSAACLNVIGALSNDPQGLIKFLRSFGLEIEELYEFPSPFSFEGRTYSDKGYVIFEWIGPQKSPINEGGGGRGQRRTSVDAFMIGSVNGKTTQILIEWKFTEGLSRELTLGRFCGKRGVERLKRYSPILAKLRKRSDFPFDFCDEYKTSDPKSRIGIYDFSPDHLYQLLRMTLLAKQTTGLLIGKYRLEDYRIVHLTHSKNDQINILHPKYLSLSLGLQPYSGRQFHDVWKDLLAPHEKERFFSGHWDKAIDSIERDDLRIYLSERYA